MARQLYQTGGIANLINTYLSNPTLQNQMTQQEYLDLFDTQPVPTTEQIIQSSVAPTIQTPIVKKPILPIQPESSGDGPPPPPGRKGITAGINFDYGYTGPSMTIDDIGEGTIPDDEYGLRMRLGDAATGIMQVGKDIYNTLSPRQIAKRTMDAINDIRTKRAAEALEQIRREEEARLQAQLNRPRVPGGTIDSGNEGSGGYGGTGGEGPSAVGSSGMLGGGV